MVIILAFSAMAGGIISKLILVGQAPYPTGVVVITNLGEINVKFDLRSPNAVRNFIRLARTGFYDGTRIHRVEQGYFIQGGDPLSKYVNLKSVWGHGGPGYTFADEVHPDDKIGRGVVAMANTGPDTNGSQFFIVAHPSLTILGGTYSIFGRVTAGMDIVDKIANGPVGVTGIPAQEVIITNIKLIQ
ncbi:MAG: peptidyl-prolyl cis-trans isomerase A (cyclophilin A) [Microgenomates group bacterium Gr01-1014_16]|nr:MAG: peptidyl-prolyl cis-trans isomerase A (cyclophilin A) [Microgenomates group bacterium Gr01-1014_16]